MSASNPEALFLFMINAASFPIGIFDSGIGGLTVAGAIHELLPGESFIYYGDTAHFPYGDKSPDLIRRYSLNIAKYLLFRSCKAIVIACNTASAHAFEAVHQLAKDKAFVINVVDPAAQNIASRFSDTTVGVIGTRGTVNSGIYPQRIKAINPSLTIRQLATPLLAPMIEEGFFNNRISHTVIHSYLEQLPPHEIKALILACTHYPLIKHEIEEFYHGSVEIIDSAGMVALAVQEVLRNNHLLNTGSSPVKEFFVSDLTNSFRQSARLFFPGEVTFKQLSVH